jgi:hypothetical protein
MSPSIRHRLVRLRVAGALSLFLGLGFGIPDVYGAWYFATHHQVWQFLGNPTNGDGPFVQLGIPNGVPVLIAFAVVCAADVVCGALLLAGRRSGRVLAVALLPVGLVFWIGFLLPFAFPLGIARSVLVLWPSRSGSSGTT